MSGVSQDPPRSDERELATTARIAVVAFLTYFCAYAMRKPWTALSFDGDPLWGFDEPKALFALSQLLGYAVSKYLGVKICSEVSDRSRLVWMIGLILFALGAFLLFPLLPRSLQPIAFFLNGLPLGMIWGLVIRYLEGRRVSEILLAALSCSYIVSSGIVKDAATWLFQDLGVARDWVPVATGAMFLPLFVLAAFLLHRAPRPSEADIRERTKRASMHGADRMGFLRMFGFGIALQCFLYFFVTAFRDFRDNYIPEILADLGQPIETGSLSGIELPVGFATLAAMASLTFVRRNRLAVRLQFAIMMLGGLLVAGSTWAMLEGWIDGRSWMIANGIGGYLAFVWSGATLFDRIIAASHTTGTAVFAIYILDAFGYTGSILLQALRGDDADISWLDFFVNICWISSAITVVFAFVNLIWFDRRTARFARESGQSTAP